MEGTHAIPAGAVITDDGATPVVVPQVKVPPTVADADTVLQRIKERIQVANKPVPDPSVPDPDKPETDIKPNDKALLAELAKAQAKVREFQDKIKASEGLTEDATFGKELKELSGTDKLKAVAKLFGKEPDEALAELVEMFYADGNSADPAKKPAAPDPGLKAVLDKLELVSKELEAIKSGSSAVTEAQKQQAAKAEQDGVKAYLRAVADKFKDEFAISTRSENIDEALEKAFAFAPEAAKALKLDPSQKLTQEQADQVAKKALAMAEAEFEQVGRRFSRQTEPPRRPSAYDLPLSKPRLEIAKKPAKESWEDTLKRYRDAYEAAR